jgi:hypothetical protein
MCTNGDFLMVPGQVVFLPEAGAAPLLCLPGRTAKAYFPIAQTSSSTNLVVLISYLHNINL